jgi:hypothetical protein
MIFVLVVANVRGSKLSLVPSPSPGMAEIQINGVPWFSPGNISVTVQGRSYSTWDGSLKPTGAAATASGADHFGSFTSTTQAWTAGVTKYMTSSRLYDGKFAIFEQSFPDGAAGTNITYLKGASSVSSCFPSVDPQPSGGKSLGYVWWGGRAFLEGSAGGVWQGDSKGSPGPGTGNGGGPFIVFGENMSDALVFAQASQFMTNTVGMATTPTTTTPTPMSNASGGASAADRSFCFGLDAPVAAVPPGK